MVTLTSIVRFLALLLALTPSLARGQITSFADINGYRVGIDMRAAADGGSGPSWDPDTGIVTSLGADLADDGATVSLINQPRYQPGPFPGLILPSPSEVGSSRCGLTIELATSYVHRRIMVVAVITPANMGGDYTQGSGRIFQADNAARNSGLFCGLFRAWTNGAGGTTTAHGLMNVAGGAAAQFTSMRHGIERQAIGYVGIGGVGAYGYCNVDGSENTTAAGAGSSSAVVQVFDVGASATSPTNNPLVGVMHAYHLWARSSTDFTETEQLLALELVRSQWSISTSRDVLISVCGDSIGGGIGTFWDKTPNTAPSQARATALASPLGSEATSLPVDSSSGFTTGTRITIAPGTDFAEVVQITAVPDAFTLAVTPTYFSHATGSVVCNDYYGIPSPYGKMHFVAKHAQGAILFDFSRGGSRALEVTASPAGDHSQDDLDGGVATVSVHELERGTNDIKTNGVTTLATLLGNAETIADNAREQGADFVLVHQILRRKDFTPTQQALADAYNAELLSSTSFDGVVQGPSHPCLQHPDNPRIFTAPGASIDTFVRGNIYDPVAIHPRRFGEACRALMWDLAYCQMMGIAVGYAPAAPTASVSIDGALLIVEWSTPSSPDAPRMAGSDGDGPSFLTAIVRINGEIIAVHPPQLIDANTGDAEYMTSYIDLYDSKVHDGDWTVEIVDAAGNSSGEVAAGTLP